MPLSRRAVLASGAAGLVQGCGRGPSQPGSSFGGGFVGEAVAAGHRWRDQGHRPGPSSGPVRRCDVLIIGAGIAGLSAARALREAGIDDVVMLELHAQPGGNSRGHAMGGLACPMGAHYLPVPDAANHDLMGWLHEIGLARQSMGRTVFEERHLCHSSQERVWHDGQWHEGLLPPAEPGTPGHAQALRLAESIRRLSRELPFGLPSANFKWLEGHDRLDQQTFGQWLDEQGITDAVLRWYLDYCCLDDYGAPAAVVSAWAGIHYFASRHGFRPPGGENDAAGEAVFTWPEGNQWLVRRLAGPLGDRLKTGWLATAGVERRDGVSVWAQRELVEDVQPGSATQAGPALAGTLVQEWSARQVILAVPLALAHRLLGGNQELLARAAGQITTSPWLVANLGLDGPLIDRPGVPPAWDNVIAGKPGLGYVDARHQSLGAWTDPRQLLTTYHAWPAGQRSLLLQKSWQEWSRWVVDDLATTHADLPSKVRQVDIVRHGHAMCIPVPGLRGSRELAALRARPLSSRLHLAHTDLVAYSVFEEAFALGLSAGRRVAKALGARLPRSS